MDSILLYQRFSDIKPQYRKLFTPYQTPSIKKVQFNLQELDLHYHTEFKVYLTPEKMKKFGGGAKKILIVGI